MARIDTDAINRNRKVMQDSTIDSPYVPVIEDSDADFGQKLYDNMPADRVGFMPSNEKNRNKR